MVRTRQPGEAALGLDRPERIYWKPFTVSLIKVKARAIVKLMQQRHPETIMFGGFISASAIGSTTIGGVFAEHRHHDETRESLEHTNSKDM